MKNVNVYFKAIINPKDSMCFMQITKYRPKFNDSAYVSYLQKVYTAISRSTSEICTRYGLNEFIYDDKRKYVLQLNSTLKDKDYITLVTIFNDEKFTYEVALKVISIRKKKL